MPFTIVGKNKMLDAVGITHVSAHTAEPTEAGLYEVIGGAYVRKPINFLAADNGNIDSSDAPFLDIPAGTTVTHIGFWTNATAGDFLAYDDIPPETFVNDGKINITDADLDLNG